MSQDAVFNFWAAFAPIFNLLLLIAIVIFVVRLVRERRRMLEQIDRIEKKVDELLKK